MRIICLYIAIIYEHYNAVIIIDGEGREGSFLSPCGRADPSALTLFDGSYQSFLTEPEPSPLLGVRGLPLSEGTQLWTKVSSGKWDLEHTEVSESGGSSQRM